MSRLTEVENDEIADLERMARQRPTGDSGGDLNSFLQVDGKEGAAFGASFVPGKYALEVIDLALKMSKGGWDEKKQITKESIPYLEITFSCIAGEDPSMVGETIQDRLMAKGKGVTRFKIFAKAVDMWDDENDQFSGCPADFMGVKVWSTIKTEKTKDQNDNERERSIIDFAGYEPIDKYPLPDDDYFDDEDEVATPAAAPVAAAPVEDDDDLEPIEDEDEEEPVQAAAPAPRPRARATGQPGDTPPWKQ
jgi:hypothetical protein